MSLFGFFNNNKKSNYTVRQLVPEDILHTVHTKEQLDAEGLGYSAEFSIFAHRNNGAMSISTVYAAIELISNGIAMMPIEVKNRQTKKKVELLNLQNIFDCNLMSRYNMVKNMISDVLLHGNGYAIIQRSSDGLPVGLRYVKAQNVTIVYKELSQELYYRVQGYSQAVEPADIIHLYKNSYDGVQGVSVLADANRSINLSNYAEQSALEYYEKGLNVQAIIHATQPMNKTQAKQAIKSVSGNMNAGQASYKFIPFDLKLEPLTLTAKDASLVETRTYNVEDIARYFNIPVTLLTSANDGKDGINLQFLTQTLTPYIVMCEEEFNRKLVSGKDIYFDFDERALLRNDAVNTASYLNTLVTGGIMSVNEARDVLGLSPVKGGDDIHIAYSDAAQNTVATADETKDK